MDNWRYKDTNRIHGTKDKARVQPNYTFSKIYRYIWDEPEEEESTKGKVSNG
jgi:tagatose-1,6-bisphosphate aldolase non-catalytic subunit AgaZ/GatZ